MAAAPPTPAQAELISSLSQDEIPIKLRCAICSKLAVNAFRLPCCEQAICETCHSSLPSSCPVCEHSPLAAEDCKPHKSLRTTIKVFLRTEEKKREAVRLKESKDTPPITPVTPVEVETQATIFKDTVPPRSAQIIQESVAPPQDVQDQDISVASRSQVEETIDAGHDIPQPSIEEIAPGQESTDDNNDNVDTSTTDQPQEQVLDKSVDLTAGMSQNLGFGMGYGFDPTNASFPMMGQSGDMNQIQMMAMQNAMAPIPFGGFPMMGMPGMSMDPMANMFLNGGFGAQGMGMNGMNMGMGMAGFDGGMGNGFNNGWNGQQSWNIGQDNFNNPNATGMGYGDFGNNSGYHQHATGFNQGNYGRNQYNDNGYGNHGQGYYPRGRGRGRGFGYQNRGGYGHNDFSQQRTQDFHNGPTAHVNESYVSEGPSAESIVSMEKVDEFGREIRETSEEKEPKELPNDVSKTTETKQTAPKSDNSTDVPVSKGDDFEEKSDKVDAQADMPKPIQTLEEIESSQTYNMNGKFSSDSMDIGSRPTDLGPGSIQYPVAPRFPDVPINAPKGPKAMREGLPNTSLIHLRARGISIPGPANTRPITESDSPVISGNQEQDSNGKAKSKTPVSRSRSRSPEREGRHSRRHRHRSTSLSEDGKEEERRRERRHRHSRKYEDEPLPESNSNSVPQSRSESPDESRRSSHRSRRERERDRERDDHRTSDREHKSSHKHRSHRSNRDRSRSRDRDRDRERHRRRHDSPESQEKVESQPAPEKEKPIKIPSGPRAMSMSSNGIEIRGGAARKNSTPQESPIESQQHFAQQDRYQDRDRTSRHREREPISKSSTSKPAPTQSQVDSHTLEREARNRERLLKEAQRIAGLAGGIVRKRSRDIGDDDRRGHKNRRKSERFEDEDGDEERIARLESEREAGRWG